MFDNTRTVTFDDKVYDKMIALNSQEGETVPLDEPVMAQGNVENWLGELLLGTHKSIHAIIRTASITIQDPAFKLLEFENMFAAQVGFFSGIRSPTQIGTS